MSNDQAGAAALNHPLFSLENLYRAYRCCRRHKRNTVNALRFEQNLEETLVFYEPTENCILRRANRADFESLPAHKSLFHAPAGCGLPIGNLTSQFFANVYLDALDQFVKHRLKARYYVRYCDDLVLLSSDPAELAAWEAEIEAFLADTLHLALNQRRRLRPVSDGIDFLGYIVRPDYLLVRRRVVSACTERLARAEKALVQQGLVLGERPVYPWHWPTLVRVYRWLNAYLAHFRHAASHRLVAQLWQHFAWLDEYFRRVEERVVYTFPPPRPALRLDQQKAHFSSRLPGHVLVVQLGTWCELWGGHPAYPLSEAERRLPRRRLPALARKLWASGAPVAWIGETGRRVTRINERALVLRWPGVAPLQPPATRLAYQPNGSAPA